MCDARKQVKIDNVYKCGSATTLPHSCTFLQTAPPPARCSWITWCFFPEILFAKKSQTMPNHLNLCNLKIAAKERPTLPCQRMSTEPAQVRGDWFHSRQLECSHYISFCFTKIYCSSLLSVSRQIPVLSSCLVPCLFHCDILRLRLEEALQKQTSCDNLTDKKLKKPRSWIKNV